MKKILILLMAVGLLYAGSDKGQKIYSKKLKKVCEMNGAKFASKHSQDEWETLKEDGNFTKEMSVICPKGKSIIESKKFQKYIDDLYDFMYEYANDSGNVPSC